MAEQINYYKVLGVPRNASRSEIKNAYRTLAKERHPDHAGGSETEFSRLQEAHAVLSDPNRRRQHDQDLDLAHAADQLAGLNLDFGSLEDEVSQKRRERETRGNGGGPSLGERLRNRFRRGGATTNGFDDRSEGRGRGRYRTPQRQARWYEPHEFDPDPVHWKTGALSFFGAFLAFILVGQIGLWATGQNLPPGFAAPWAFMLGPFMFVLYSLSGLLAAYFAYRAAGWGGIALVFVAALIVGGSGGPVGLVQFVTVGIVVLLAVIYLGIRRNRTARRDRR
ncbi:MAG: DnaJ domain-containing protein [Actinobacteria bacterium]|jgi:molecular chaperone DnaJ|nr:DnaJ domain-containing protein [Actinomycetota bacterium]